MQSSRSRLATSLSLALALSLCAAPVLAKPGNGNGPGSGGPGSGGPGSGPAPYLSFDADRTDVTIGETVTLSWASTNTRHCFASGDWSGKLATDGFYTTPPLDGSKTFNLECKDGGNSVTASIAVQVSAPTSGTEPIPEPTPEPVRAPILTLTAADTQVLQGSSTQLDWSSSDADSCTASGGWSGTKATSGNESAGPLDAATTFSLTCTGAGGSVTDNVTVNVEAAPQPTLTLQATDTVVPAGSTTTLGWSAADADSCTAGGGWSGTKATNGNESVGPLDAATTFSLSCSGSGGSVSDSVTVNVEAPPQPEPTLTLQAADTVVPSGGTTTLSWSATDADSCTAGGGWSGSKATSGSESVGPLDADTNFSLTCSGAGGSVSGIVIINVEAPPQPTLTLQAADTVVPAGGTTTLSWSATDADSCTAGGGWSGSKATSGNESVGPLDAATTFSLSCTGSGGSVSDSVTVNVEATPEPTLTLQATDTMVPSGGTTTLSWSATDADSCTASGGWSGIKATSGSESVGPLDAATTFSLSCTGSGGSVSDSVTVNVEATPEPTLTLQATDTVVPSSGTTTLSWSATDADSCTASGGWSGTKATSGNESVGPLDAATTFSLTCTGAGGTIADSVTVNVENPPEPTVSLQAADSVVNEGSSTTLSWSATDADSCSASGGWSGDRSTSGSELTAPLSAQTTFSLSCSGAGGNAMSMISVAVNGTVTLEWQAPTQNVDGSELTDLWGYRIYYGVSSGSYTDSIEIASATASSEALTLPSGDYYFAMTAVDASGNESAFSNEVLKSVD